MPEIFPSAILESFAKDEKSNRQDKALEILRVRTYIKKYQGKIAKFEKSNPNIRSDDQTPNDIFMYGKIEALKEVVEFLQAVHDHTLEEGFKNWVKKKYKKWHG